MLERYNATGNKTMAAANLQIARQGDPPRYGERRQLMRSAIL